MSFTEFFENLTHEINDSRTARRARIGEIKHDTHELLERFHGESQQRMTDVEKLLSGFRSDHQRMAKELKRKLKTDEEARVEAAHEFHEQLRDFADDLRRGGEIFRGNRAASFPKESRKKKRA